MFLGVDVLPVHTGDDCRRGPTRWRRKTRGRDSNGQPCKDERGELDRN